MNKIKFIANRETNYIFHMLSVSKCGYDNSYRDAYKHLYSQEDLAVLKNNEDLLTIRGGEHVGKLMWIIASGAMGNVPAKELYQLYVQKIYDGDYPQDLSEYKELILQICNVMIKHYDYYVENIWNIEKEKIEKANLEFQKLFDESDFTEKAEKLLGCKLSQDFFIATMVSSIKGGPEAIVMGADDDAKQDIFDINKAPLDVFHFVGHEFIIFLLMQELKDVNELDDWKRFESLAEYYLIQILGNSRGFFDDMKDYIEFYETCNKDKNLSAVELFKKAGEFIK
ncbi:MAG: hypothetical protein J6C25_00265 [Treponema sp.]|nr:hypothetical protein [Treponema sp.]